MRSRYQAQEALGVRVPSGVVAVDEAEALVVALDPSSGLSRPG
ncbi:hypothetical protein PUR71_38185 [Streptomyces sp. SP17BM10]|nr:hypothetical protein [Streptomyces sp. SP17BM10]MEE1788692.1 hypothetical protein [Streptomyces sp. SP17BM10]